MRLRSLFRTLSRRTRFESDMQEEVRSHIENYAEDLARAGVPRQEALRRARLEFGSLERVKEECRQARGLRVFDELARNLRYAARLLRKSPGFTATAVLTLALCIGANTAVFSVVDAVLLRPLPFPEPERLVSVVTVARFQGAEQTEDSQNGATWERIRDHASYLDAAVVGLPGGASLVHRGRAEHIEQSRVSAGYFHVLGVTPFLGRDFNREDDRRGSAPVAVLSYELWRRSFNGDPGAIGTTVTLRGESCTVIGVLPEGFRLQDRADLWTPLQPSATGEGAGENYGILARLKAGVTWSQAQAQIESIGVEALKDLRRRSPEASARLALTPYQKTVTAGAKRPLLILWAAAAMILLIGCINIAGLLLARGASRTREIATRMALGGGRGAVLRQMFTESLLLALCGGLAGTLLGYAGARGLVLLARGNLEIWQTVRLDARVLAATLLLSVITSVLSGVLPALLSTRLDVRWGLVDQGARGIAGARSGLPRRLLIVGEVAIGIVLLVGAGLLIRTFAHLHGMNPGFDPSGVIAASLPLRDARYGSEPRVERLVNDSLERIRQLPGVEAAAMGLSLPFERPLNVGCRRVDGPDVDGSFRTVNLTYVSPDYFRTLRIPLLRGRVFTPADTRTSESVIVVNESFVKKHLPRQEPVGSHLSFGGPAARRFRIVGVIGDVLQKPNFVGYEPLVPMPGAFVPLTQMSDDSLQMVHVWFSPSWIVRSPRPEAEIVAGIARAIEAVDPMLPVAGFQTLRQLRGEKLAPQRTQAVLVGIMAGLALLLAAVGIYGLIANSVAERTRELGIRMALGAGVLRTIGGVARTGITLALAGVAAGCVLAVFAVRVLEHAVYGVRTTDVATFLGVSALLLAVACAASVIPALRLARLSPAESLRQE